MGLIQGPGTDPARPVHGGLNGTELRALGLRAAEVLDFSASINPLGVSPAVTEALRHLDLPAAVRRIAALRPALLFLCNPNNPTGTYLGADDLEAIAAALGDAGLLVLDEAYAPFVERRWDTTRLLRLGNVVLLRSMTKDHALTGLRLGYLLGPRAVVRQVRRWQPSWSVNAAAQAAGIAALSDHGHVARGRREVRSGRRYLTQELASLGLPGTAAAANFLLVRVGAAAALRLRLLREHRLCVRDCASFGLPRHVRIGVRRMADCRRLVGALRQVLGNGDG